MCACEYEGLPSHICLFPSASRHRDLEVDSSTYLPSSPTGQGRGQGIFNFLDSRLEPLPHSYYESSEIYRTAPNTSPKRSIATHTPTATPTNKRLKLTPRKFGMFASSTTDMPPAIPEIEYDEEFQNEAGEAMDDLLGPETTPVRKLNFGLNRPTFAPLPLPTPTSAFDGDVEDNQDLSSDGAEGDAKAAIRAFKPRVGRSKRSTAAASLWEEIQRSAEKALQTVGRERRDSVVAGRASPRLATRGEVKLMGERTAFLKKGMEGRVSSKGEVLKRGMRLRNWRGELIGDGEAIVVVRLGEVEDVGEFERLFD